MLASLTIESEEISHPSVQHVTKGPQPKFEEPTPRWWDPEDTIGTGPYQYTPENANGAPSNGTAQPKPDSPQGHEKPLPSSGRF